MSAKVNAFIAALSKRVEALEARVAELEASKTLRLRKPKDDG